MVAGLKHHGGNNKNTPSNSESATGDADDLGQKNGRERGRRKRREDKEGWQKELEVDAGGQGHSCDEELRMKDVASVRP